MCAIDIDLSALWLLWCSGQKSTRGKGSGPHSYGCNSKSLAWIHWAWWVCPRGRTVTFLPVSAWYCGTKEKCIKGKMRKDCLPIKTVYRQSEDVYLTGRGYGKPFMLLWPVLSRRNTHAKGTGSWTSLCVCVDWTWVGRRVHLETNGLGASYIQSAEHPELLTVEYHYFSVPTSNKDSWQNYQFLEHLWHS